MPDRLRLSKADRDRLAILRHGMAFSDPPGALAYAHGAKTAWDIVLLRAAQFETPPDPALRDPIAKGAAAIFPVKPADLMPDLQGPALRATLKRLEARWIASDFTLTRQDLLGHPR